MTRERFEQLVEDALKMIPRRFRGEMRNVAVVVEDEPSDELLDELEVPEDDTLFGLYQGTPLPERGWAHGNNLPDRISIYQFPIEDACDTNQTRQKGKLIHRKTAESSVEGVAPEGVQRGRVLPASEA